MTPAFWAFVALDAALFLILVVLGITSPGTPDGGREMSLIFFVVIPAIIVIGAAVLFTKAQSSGLLLVALGVVAGPRSTIAFAKTRREAATSRAAI
jgi:hypothetical protein